MNTQVNIAGITFKNPVMTASGTFGSGMEYSEFCDLNRLGAVVTKGVSAIPWEGNPTPRVAEVYGGMLNAIGLQNPGIDVFVKRDIPYLARMLGKGSIYIDVMASMPFEECYSPEHPASQRDDRKTRRRLLSYIKDKMGSLASEALPSEDVMDVIDLGAYMGEALEAQFPPKVRRAYTIPLWQLVYHDCLFCFTNAYNHASVQNYHPLCALFGMLPGNLDTVSLELSRKLRQAYKAEMLDFKFLTPPVESYNYVAQAKFADGTVVIANMTDEEYNINDIRIKPHDFIIRQKSTPKKGR